MAISFIAELFGDDSEVEEFKYASVVEELFGDDSEVERDAKQNLKRQSRSLKRQKLKTPPAAVSPLEASAAEKARKWIIVKEEAPGTILVAGAESVRPEYMGTFKEATVEPIAFNGGRPIYQKDDACVFLYFWEPLNRWRIGPDFRYPNAAVSGGGDAALPHLCSHWKMSVDGRWVEYAEAAEHISDQPSAEQLKYEVTKILKGVDLESCSLKTVRGLLESRFSLAPGALDDRKDAITELVTQEINRLQELTTKRKSDAAGAEDTNKSLKKSRKHRKEEDAPKPALSSGSPVPTGAPLTDGSPLSAASDSPVEALPQRSRSPVAQDWTYSDQMFLAARSGGCHQPSALDESLRLYILDRLKQKHQKLWSGYDTFERRLWRSVFRDRLCKVANTRYHEEVVKAGGSWSTYLKTSKGQRQVARLVDKYVADAAARHGGA